VYEIYRHLADWLLGKTELDVEKLNFEFAGDLRGTVRQRAQALIDITHPKFREDLYQFCEKTGWLQRPLAAETAVAR
jgi:acyl-CoA hydrolase